MLRVATAKRTAISLAQQALPLPDLTDFGSLPTEKVLLAVESWNLSPNSAALRVMSDTLGRLPRRLTTWTTGIEPRAVAISPSGRDIAVSDGRAVLVYDRTGLQVAELRRTTAETFEQAMAFTTTNELSLVTSEKVCRGRVDKWSEIRCEAIRGPWVFLSRDGEWVATTDRQHTILRRTDLTGVPKSVEGRALCFIQGNLRLLRPGNQDSDGSTIVDLPLSEGGFESDPKVGHIPGELIQTCSWGSVVYYRNPDGVVDHKIEESDAPVFVFPDSGGGNATFDDDGSRLALVRYGRSQLWRPKSPRWEFVLHLPGGGGLAFGVDEVLIGGPEEDHRLTIADIRDPRLISQAKATSTKSGSGSSFGRQSDGAYVSPDGQWRLEYAPNGYTPTGGQAVTATVVSTSDHNVVLSIPTKVEGVDGAFSSDSKTIALTYGEVTQVWSIDGDRYTKALCELLPDFVQRSTGMAWNPEQYDRACRSRWWWR
jgi:hypothetical protein